MCHRSTSSRSPRWPGAGRRRSTRRSRPPGPRFPAGQRSRRPAGPPSCVPSPPGYGPGSRNWRRSRPATTGPCCSHRRSVMPRVAHNFEFFADWLGHLDPGDREVSGHAERVSWDPSGVTAVITPWNAPLMLATWRIAPALAAGNTVVAKPPEWAPLTASLLADITHEAGLPDGVFNVVQGLGAKAGAPLAAHPNMARVAFTGSVATGRLIAAAAGAQLTPMSLELGGKSPLIVFGDADLDLAVRHAVGQFDNAGQVCLAGTRLLVDEAIAGEFTARFTVRAAALRQGDPRDEAV